MFKANALLLCTALGLLYAATAGATPPASSYPASCLPDGAPLGKSSSDPNAVTKALTLYSYNTTLGGYTSEAATVIVWRVPCSGGKAATVLEIERSAANEGSTTQYFLFPQIYLTTSASTTATISPRLAREPNTLYEDTAQGVGLYSSVAVVLEHYESTNARSSPSTDYSQAFTVNINNLAGGSALVFDVPAYTAPASPPLLEVSGYLTTTWTNPNQSGEGIFLQVYTLGDHANRTLSFAWFTYDDLHMPFWLFGQTPTFPIGSQTVTANTAYLQGGSFSPDAASAAVPPTIWGTVTFSFPDCNTMSMTYTGDASAVQGPTGSGTRTFTRVGENDNLVCS